MEITHAVAEKVLATVDAGLTNGQGNPIPGQMCVEAAVCFAMGLPHGDNPSCVSPALRSLKIALNDKAWSSKEARAAGLRRLALAQLGSAGVLDDREFLERVAAMTIRKIVPLALRVAAKRNPKHADRLEAAALRCEQEGTRASAKAAQKVADAAYADAAADADAADAAYAYAAAYAAYAADAAYAYAAAYAAYAAADAAADAAAYAAADAVADAAADAAADADAVADAAADADAARDRVLADYCEWVVEILIEMQAPGCQWLVLAPKAA